jgi:hypothetical protein
MEVKAAACIGRRIRRHNPVFVCAISFLAGKSQAGGLDRLPIRTADKARETSEVTFM